MSDAAPDGTAVAPLVAMIRFARTLTFVVMLTLLLLAAAAGVAFAEPSTCAEQACQGPAACAQCGPARLCVRSALERPPVAGAPLCVVCAVDRGASAPVARSADPASALFFGTSLPLRR